MEAEEVDVSGVAFNGRRKIVLVDLVKYKVEVYRCRKDVCLDEVYKDRRSCNELQANCFFLHP